MKITRYRGDTDPISMTITNNSTGSPANLTGSTVKLTTNTKANPTDSSTVLFQLTGISSDPLTGVVEFMLSDTDADKVGTFYYDVELTKNDGKKSTIVKGVIEFTQDITK